MSKWRVSLTPFRYGGSGTSLRLTRVLSQTGHVGFRRELFPQKRAGRKRRPEKQSRLGECCAWGKLLCRRWSLGPRES